MATKMAANNETKLVKITYTTTLIIDCEWTDEMIRQACASQVRADCSATDVNMVVEDA